MLTVYADLVAKYSFSITHFSTQETSLSRTSSADTGQHQLRQRRRLNKEQQERINTPAIDGQFFDGHQMFFLPFDSLTHFFAVVGIFGRL